MSDNKKLLAAVAVILILVGALGVGIYHNLLDMQKGQPVTSLRAARKAVEEHDLETFKKYVDTEKILNVAAEEILTAQINSELAPTAYSTGELQTRYENQLKPDFVNTARAALEEYITTGNVTFTDELSDAQKFFKESGAASCEIKSFTKPHAKGNVKFSEVIFYNPVTKFSFEIELELTPDEKADWRITNAKGFESFYSGRQRALRQKLDSLNAPVAQQMDEILKVKSFRAKHEEGDEYGFSETLILSVKADVNSDKPLEKILGNIILLDKNGKENFTPFAIDMTGHEQGVQTFEVTKTLNPFIRADVDAMKHGIRKKDLRLEVTEIIFEDGSNLKLLDSLPEGSY